MGCLGAVCSDGIKRKKKAYLKENPFLSWSLISNRTVRCMAPQTVAEISHPLLTQLVASYLSFLGTDSMWEQAFCHRLPLTYFYLSTLECI